MPDQTPCRRRPQTRDALDVGMGERRLSTLIESGHQLGGSGANRLRRRWPSALRIWRRYRMARLLDHDNDLCAFCAMAWHEVRTSHNGRPGECSRRVERGEPISNWDWKRVFVSPASVKAPKFGTAFIHLHSAFLYACRRSDRGSSLQAWIAERLRTSRMFWVSVENRKDGWIRSRQHVLAVLTAYSPDLRRFEEIAHFGHYLVWGHLAGRIDDDFLAAKMDIVAQQVPQFFLRGAGSEQQNVVIGGELCCYRTEVFQR